VVLAVLTQEQAEAVVIQAKGQDMAVEVQEVIYVLLLEKRLVVVKVQMMQDQLIFQL
tara:strand:+ start:291 stop:461 length:171 start_codon:yes stop_codon:yes gene_type:complete